MSFNYTHHPLSWGATPPPPSLEVSFSYQVDWGATCGPASLPAEDPDITHIQVIPLCRQHPEPKCPLTAYHTKAEFLDLLVDRLLDYHFDDLLSAATDQMVAPCEAPDD